MRNERDIAIHSDSRAGSAVIAELVERWTLAWNAHDATQLAALVADDVAFVTVGGKRLMGRAEFKEHHGRIHWRGMRDSIWETLGSTSRELPGSLLLVHVEWSIAGDRDGADNWRARRFGVFTWIVTTTDASPSIAIAHNTNLQAGEEHRTATAIKARREIEGAPL